MTRYTVQFKHNPNGAKACNIEADSEAAAIAQAGKSLGCFIDPTDPDDQSGLLEAIPQAQTPDNDRLNAHSPALHDACAAWLDDRTNDAEFADQLRQIMAAIKAPF